MGNSVESGHYMAWIKQDDSEEWVKYDDDTVYTQPEDKVFQLRGGQPNLEIAYLLMFRKVYAKPVWFVHSYESCNFVTVRYIILWLIYIFENREMSNKN